jgi:hypothetical protein
MKKIKLNLMKKINLNPKTPMLKVIVIIVNFIGDRAESALIRFYLVMLTKL